LRAKAHQKQKKPRTEMGQKQLIEAWSQISCLSQISPNGDWCLSADSLLILLG
jgi:hypothetical protein